MVLRDAQIPVSLTTLFQCLIFINGDNCPEWVVTVNSVSVIWGCSTLLNVIAMRNLVSTKLYSFDQASVYLKAVLFLLITFLEQRSFLTIFYRCDRLHLLKVLFIS